MKTASLVFGILSTIGMMNAFIPCFGWLNWFNIPFAVIGLILGLIALGTRNEGESNEKAIAGIVLCIISIIIGIIRLNIGGGIL